ncbi:hypothetical protein A2996_02150 [Candidatus Campbellbacteria bacterium RIFCSPLOWO2_01_FULL_34_15]|uniref:UDP-N-acetylglucosamine 2-epimerase domain-containing protein n=2 Tax=Candidatus Campbelliibacteriota TaxID=1752727 RepID=A0A1F5ELG8_9BACT|nr:MAG: hypothetical protein A2996_02150 [Candidatus Campbellbacteria bacterium RIFCSPLOWO2_01_FULL_34_15]OGD69573.1 MAG: hypothetical protein A2811_01590 [Candidatus Campbellbacteria bacterium RIFCSPHIGHO2_01_FULL_34_10]
MRKTIFIVTFHAYIAKNILNTDIFKILSKNNNLRIVIFVNENKVDYFKNLYQSDNVIIEGLNPVILLNNKHHFFNRVSKYLIDSHYLHYKRVQKKDTNKNFLKYLRFIFETLVVKIFSNTPYLYKVFRYSYIKFGYQNLLGLYFKKYNPNVIFCTDVFDMSNTIFSQEAKRNNVLTIGMVRSWDNCYSKGLLKVVSDKFIVNNETIKDELIKKQFVGDTPIFIGGLPQFDRFLREERQLKEEFSKDIGVNLKNKKLIVFAPAGSILSDTDDQICEIIRDSIKNGKLLHNVHVHVRNHPNHPADLDRFKSDDNFTIETPGRSFGNDNLKEKELTKEEGKHLADTLYNADLIIWVATTLGIDAVVFDKPQIVINFDGFEKREYYHSVKKYHDEDHMKKMLDLGGATVVNNPEELIFWINQYLSNPSLNRDKRKLMAEQQLWKLDGKSGERIGNFLSEEIKNA